MVPEARFKIVFDEVESMRDSGTLSDPAITSDADALREELDELAELRQLVAEMSDPGPTSFTST